MSKMKPRKAAAKRMTLTGTGKVKRRKCGLTHLQTKRSSRTQQRNNDAAVGVADSDYKAVTRMLARKS
jgi:large subunit ribosomal protein L35